MRELTHLITIEICHGTPNGTMARGAGPGPNLSGTGRLNYPGSSRKRRRDMTTDTDPRAVAIEQLEALGLSTYAARTYVALARLGEGTATDVSEVADVPRTRVYDAAEELREEGLVDIQRADPRRFRTVSTETTGRRFERKYARRVELLTDALGAVSDAERTTEQDGVWTVTGRGTVTERVVEFVETAADEVVYMTVGELLTDEVAASLRAASGRGVDIRLGEMSGTAEDRLHEAVPEAGTFDSLWNWSDTPAGRVLMVDGERTLVSVLVPDDDGADARDETAIWGSGTTNSLVVVLRTLFTWQLDGTRE